MSERNNGKMLLAFFVGATIGATLGLLFAPRSGKDTRARVKIMLEDLGDKASEISEEGKEKIGEIISRGRETIKKAISK